MVVKKEDNCKQHPSALVFLCGQVGEVSSCRRPFLQLTVNIDPLTFGATKMIIKACIGLTIITPKSIQVPGVFMIFQNWVGTEPSGVPKPQKRYQHPGNQPEPNKSTQLQPPGQPTRPTHLSTKTATGRPGTWRIRLQLASGCSQSKRIPGTKHLR